ncbi:unnamed protein product [Arabis nemorensis]|uniref:RNase H type-1 domain-containing protein n=1 Tax=Arabis nemorensis TaxID=586526 RepID=A0A565AM58_9BRAS|nr:unnamed protein product [Arabis nemorensis]
MTMTTTSSQRIYKWKPPPTSWLKCIVDGAWSKGNTKSGVGWILRDKDGKVKWLGARAYPKLRTSVETEVEALRWALLSTLSLGYQQVIFETDAQVVLKAINGEEE